MHYYAVRKGKVPGIYTSWEDCQETTSGFKGALFKKFNNVKEAGLFLCNPIVEDKNKNKELNYKKEDNQSINISLDELLDKKIKTNIKQCLKKKFSNINNIIVNTVNHRIKDEIKDISNNVQQDIKNINKIVRAKVDKESIDVYTDGSCSNNGKKGAKAGIGVWFGKNDKRNVSKRIIGKQTNNAAELSAILEVYSILKDDIEKGKLINIYTDSRYCIDCLTHYGYKQEMTNWNKNIPNKELVKKIYYIYKDLQNVIIKHVKAHTNKSDKHSIGNRFADDLAVKSIKNK